MTISLESLSFLAFNPKEDEWLCSNLAMRSIYTIIKFIEENDVFSATIMDRDMVAALGYNLGYPELMYEVDNQADVVAKLSINEFKTLCRFKLVKLFKTTIEHMIGKLTKYNNDPYADKAKYSSFFTESLMVSSELYSKLSSYEDYDLSLVEYELKNFIEYDYNKNKIDSSGYFKYFLNKYYGSGSIIKNSDNTLFNTQMQILKCLCLSFILANQYSGSCYERNCSREIHIKVKPDNSGYNRTSKIFNQLNNDRCFSPLVLLACYDNLNVIPSILNSSNSDRVRLSSGVEEQEFLYSVIYLDQFVNII